MRELVDRCNRGPFPLREFIDRTLGPGVNHRDYSQLLQRAIELTGPIDIICCETLGASIGHTGGLARVDFC